MFLFFLLFSVLKGFPPQVLLQSLPSLCHSCPMASLLQPLVSVPSGFTPLFLGDICNLGSHFTLSYLLSMSSATALSQSGHQWWLVQHNISQLSLDLSLDTQTALKLENVFLFCLKPCHIVKRGSQVGLHVFTRTSFLSFFPLHLSLLCFYENCCPLMRYTALFLFRLPSHLSPKTSDEKDCPNTQIFPPLLTAFCTILFPSFAIFSPPIH